MGVLMNDARIRWYSLALAIPGLLFAFYHVLLYYNVIEGSIIPCTQGISCTTRQIEWLGFITIPLMSLLAFSAICFFLMMYRPDKSTRLNQGVESK